MVILNKTIGLLLNKELKLFEHIFSKNVSTF